MGFKMPNLSSAYSVIRQSLGEISSPMNDGFTSSHCKQELYLLKCWLDDEYTKLPIFSGEEQWEQQRVINILKR